MSAATARAEDKKAPWMTAEELRGMALRQAAAWNDNTDALRDTFKLTEWRDNCRDEVRDAVLSKEGGDLLLAAWANAFDDVVLGASDAADDIECAIETANDLLRLALDKLAGLADNGAAAAIRGAQRFIDDISDIAHVLHAMDGVFEFAAKSDGGAA